MNTAKFNIAICSIAICLLITACNNSNSKEEQTDTLKTDTAKKTAETNNTTDSSFTLKARFVSYQLGDASHFIFKDEKGKEWDFADSEDSNIKFAIELPADKANEQNQGFTSNKELVGKWFTIRYVYKMLPQYQDGPMAKAPVIIEARLAE